MKIHFGKHIDEEIKDIPTAYLKWVLDKCKDIAEELYDEIVLELESRHEEQEPEEE